MNIENMDNKLILNEIKNTSRNYIFIPLQIHDKTWVAIIIDKKGELFFYLNPNGPQHHLSKEINDLYYCLYRQASIIQNTFEFNNNSGSSIIEIFRIVVNLTSQPKTKSSASKMLSEKIIKNKLGEICRLSEGIAQQHKNMAHTALLILISSSASNENVLLLPSCFGWLTEDRKLSSGKPTLPPIGMMRNYCLKLAKSVYMRLVEKNANNIQYVSLDGDTKLTSNTWRHILEKVGSNDDCAIVSAGYELFDNTVDSNNDLEKVLSHLSMNVYARLNALALGFYGYFSEPTIALSALLTTIIFSENINLDTYLRDSIAPYGFWDLEGRRFLNYCRQLTARLADKSLIIYGPSIDPAARPILVNIERFKIQPNTAITPTIIQQMKAHVLSNPERLITLTLPQKTLIALIQKMSGQSINCAHPYFMGRNISSYLHVDVSLVRVFASYFYLRAFFECLNLGPRRSHYLIRALFEHYIEGKSVNEKMSDHKWMMTFSGINTHPNQHEEIAQFINSIFIIGLGAIIPVNSRLNLELIHVIRQMILYWALQLSAQLMAVFGPEYEGEAVINLANDEIDYLRPIACPAEYPKNANTLAESDSNNIVDVNDDNFLENDTQQHESSDSTIVNKRDINVLELAEQAESFLKDTYTNDGYLCRKENLGMTKSFLDYQSSCVKISFAKKNTSPKIFLVIGISDSIPVDIVSSLIDEESVFSGDFCIIKLNNHTVEISGNQPSDDAILSNLKTNIGFENRQESNKRHKTTSPTTAPIPADKSRWVSTNRDGLKLTLKRKMDDDISSISPTDSQEVSRSNLITNSMFHVPNIPVTAQISSVPTPQAPNPNFQG
jgi:hypothetical protein